MRVSNPWYGEYAIYEPDCTTDVAINFAQKLLTAQFKNVRELESTSLLEKSSSLLKDTIQLRIEILFCKV